MHLETISFAATQPNTGAAAAALTGDSLTIKNSKGTASIIAWWPWQQVDGYQQMITPTAHDTTRGVRFVSEANEITSFLPAGIPLEVQPQELMSIQIAGSNTAGDVELGVMLVRYDDLPGVTSRMIGYGDLLRRVEKLTTLQVTLTGAATGYTGEELITAESDLLHANRDYAVLGFLTNVPCAGIYLKGPDTGYQRVTCPGGSLDPDEAREWFCWLSRTQGKPHIPIFNSGNKASTYVGFIQNENNISPVISMTLALLSKN
jgi:hypothetical protein